VKEVNISEDIRIVEEPNSHFWHVHEKAAPGEYPHDYGCHPYREWAERAAKRLAAKNEQVKATDAAYQRALQRNTEDAAKIKQLRFDHDGWKYASEAAQAAYIAANARAYKLEQENASLRGELLEKNFALCRAGEQATKAVRDGTSPLHNELAKVRAKHAAATKLVTELKYQVRRHETVRTTMLAAEKELRATIKQQAEEINHYRTGRLRSHSFPQLIELQAKLASRESELQRATRRIAYMQSKAQSAITELTDCKEAEPLKERAL
jgi:hypothetical protein